MSRRQIDNNFFDQAFDMNELRRFFLPQMATPQENVSERVWSPAIDVYEDKDAIVIHADLPGVSQEDIDIEMTGDTLTLKGERKFESSESKENYVRLERRYGKFQRSFTIGVPVESEKISALYRNGILELTIPKAEVTKPKKVPVAIA
jgi:HSP20 family protein